MGTLGSRVKSRRNQLKISQKEVARAMGVTPASVSQLENDVTTSVRGLRLMALAKVLECSPDWLMSGREKPGSMVNSGSRVPVIRWSDLPSVTQGVDVDISSTMPAPVPCGSDTVVLPVEGEAMEPTLRSGDFIYVDPDVAVREDCLAVVVVDGVGVVRRVLREGGSWFVRPDNPSWPVSVQPLDLDRVFGVVVFSGRPM